MDFIFGVFARGCRKIKEWFLCLSWRLLMMLYNEIVIVTGVNILSVHRFFFSFLLVLLPFRKCGRRHLLTL